MGGPERTERGYGGYRSTFCPKFCCVIVLQPGALSTDSS